MKTAFSLIELLVVVAIITILAAIALPIYNQYAIRAQMSQAYSMALSFAEPVLATYQKTGYFPSNITVNGLSIPSGYIVTNINLGNILSVDYSGPSSDGKAMILEFVFYGGLIQNIPGYSTYVAGHPGAYSRLSIAWRDVNGTIQVKCGAFSPSNVPQIIPYPYAPSACTCSNVSNFYANGGSASC